MQPQRPTPDIDRLRESFSRCYDSIDSLKAGGQALLYRGRRFRTPKDVDVDEPVAIKLYLNPNEDARIDKEISAAREATCESLVRVLSQGKTRIAGIEYRFVVWEFIDGLDLEQMLEKGPCQPSLVALIGRDVSVAVDALWRKRIVHRDINPKNIMIRRGEEKVVLIDLGIAKHVEQTGLTAPGLTWGTHGYLSPEQLSGSNLTCQSDIFSLGVTLLQALHGDHPSGLDQARLIYGLPKTHQLCPSSPAGLASILDRMVQTRPARRPQLPELIAEFTKLAEVL